MNPSSSVYRSALGASFDALPTAVQAFHSLTSTSRLTGEVTLFGAETVVGRLLVAFMRMGKPGGPRPLAFVLSATPTSETWSRKFGARRPFTSTIAASPTMLTERIGPIKLWYRVTCAPEALTMTTESATLLGCRLPALLTPKIRATEHGSGARLHFDVGVEWPGKHRLVRYTGHLDLGSTPQVVR